MLILAFDTSAGHCAAALLDGDQVLAATAQNMVKGQAEHLMPLLETLLANHTKSWADLDRIGVGTGPGNFTGLRISIAAARGLALALNIPAIGVSTIEAMRHTNPDAIPAIPAPRNMVFLARPGAETVQIPAQEAPDIAVPPPPPADLAIAIARKALTKDPADCLPPAPLYLRPADAAPPRDAPPEIIP